MPRTARQKTYDAIFHIMARSISEVDLFKDNDDKNKYMALIKKYQKVYKFRVYGYCLMNNHVHLIIDANGADISKIMHGVNFSYAQYFNKRHKRHGHLFQDRFKSKMVPTERYLFALSAYIHNNPITIRGFENKPEKYRFSSLSIYLGLISDPFEVLDDEFILSMMGNDVINARKNYRRFVMLCDDKKLKEETEFKNERTEYRSGRKILVRDFNAEDILEFVATKMNITEIKLHTKYCRNVIKAKALLVLLMRSFCNYKCSDICNLLGNVTQVRVSKLSSIGMNLIDEEENYKEMVCEFIERYSA